MKKQRRSFMQKVGPVGEKILLLLEAGIVLGLTSRPDAYFRVLKQTAKEWRRIDSRALHDAIKRLYRSQLVDYQKNTDGSISLLLSHDGEKRALRYRLDTITIQKPPRWDGNWRIVLFDIPEQLKQGRDALSQKLKRLGFRPMQKSVFVFPYECKDEVDFIVEMFGLRPYVRYLVVKEMDAALDFKNQFHLT